MPGWLLPLLWLVVLAAPASGTVPPAARTVGGVTTRLYDAGAQRIEEHDASNQAVYLYFYEAPGSDRLLFRQGGPWWRLWYQTDLLGNTTHLSAEQYNSNGQLTGGSVVEQYLYDPFGTPTVYDAAGRVRPGGSALDNRRLFSSFPSCTWERPCPSTGSAACLGARSRRVMVQVLSASGSMHYSKSTSRQRPHNAAPSSRPPSVEREYAHLGRQGRAEPEDRRQMA